MREETFGNRLRALRIKRGMRRNYLAKQACINPSYLKRLEDGQSEPIQEIVERLAILLDTTPQYLLIGEDPFLRLSLKNLATYVRNKGIAPEEANLLETKVKEEIRRRPGSTLTASEFDIIRNYQRKDDSIAGICYRCGHAVLGSAGDRCSNCGRAWYSPDN